MAFVSNTLDFKMREDLSSADISSLWIEIERKHHRNVVIAGVYREWGKSGAILKNRSKDQQKDRLMKLNDQIKRAKNNSNEVALIGDFNICMDKTFNGVIEHDDKIVVEAMTTRPGLTKWKFSTTHFSDPIGSLISMLEGFCSRMAL